ncbi:sensor histidine kinase [Oceanobacillus salinisoli]|uniref:sensor histidine kinase n=1 Tax=Oceanobacillus salinisoli TaxID=2678611 RepID=UPI0012E221E1
MVRDQGSGIPELELPHVFQRFYTKENNSNSGSYGLGLAICKEIIEAHKGKIWVESKEGEGSTFGFTLPTFDI